MTYLRDPRNRLIWESDGDFKGKFAAEDGTLHDSPEEVEIYERQKAGGQDGKAS